MFGDIGVGTMGAVAVGAAAPTILSQWVKVANYHLLQTIIQKIFNFAARIISRKRKYDHSSGVREDLGWLDSKDLFTQQTLSLLHSVRVNGQSESLAVQFCTNRGRPNHVRSTRRDDLLSLPNIRGSAAGKRQLAYRAAHQY